VQGGAGAGWDGLWVGVGMVKISQTPACAGLVGILWVRGRSGQKISTRAGR